MTGIRYLRPYTTYKQGTAVYTYIVTGTTQRGKRFKPIICRSYVYAMAINLYNGSVWRETYIHGKRTRKLLKRVYN